MLTKIQCDQGRPHCGNCEKYGAICPGYSKEFKFIVDKHNASKARSAAVIHSRRASRSPQSPEPPEPAMEPQPWSLDKVTGPDYLQSPELYVAQGLSFLIEYLIPADQSVIIGRWLSFLPTRPTISGELNCALRCFVTYQLGRLNNNQQMMQYSRSEYVHALSKLQRALRSPTWSSSDTLCAAILLGVYEVFTTEIPLLLRTPNDRKSLAFCWHD